LHYIKNNLINQIDYEIGQDGNEAIYSDQIFSFLRVRSATAVQVLYAYRTGENDSLIQSRMFP